MNASWQTLRCPYCGERFEAPLEHDEADTQVIDCAVCCRPIHLHERGGQAGACREDDA